MAKHYYDPMLCSCSPENPMTMGVTAVLTEEIDGELLKEAAEELRERFAYFYVRAKIEDNDIVVVPNPLPMTVRNTWAPIELASKEANYHLAAIKYEGNRICLEMNHALSDGAGVSPFFKSLLFVYLSKKTGVSFPAQGFRLPGSEAPLSETGDPFAAVDTDSIQGPFYQKEPTQDFYRLPSRTGEADHIYYLKMPVSAVMKYCKENDGSPNVLMAVLIARAIRRVDPISEKPVTVSVAIDHKSMLGNSENYRMFANAYELDFPKERQLDDIMKLCTMTRGQLMLQAQPENSAWYIKTRKMGFEKMKAMPLQMKLDILPKAASASRWTASVSYVNSRSFGPLDPYIKELYNLAEVRSIDVMCEIACINNSFFVALAQCNSSRELFEALLCELEQASIPFEIMRDEEYHLCGLRYEDL
ncbi:MAG: hypothetical protein IIZ62_08120 [Ruminococcus sp.]|nr:hypothetical protein [Ruminococcus sp.]